MNHIISWFEIPSLDFSRAVSFYKSILQVDIYETEMMGFTMGFFPSDGTNVSGSIICGEGAIPSTDGCVVYLHGGEDLQVVLDRVEPNGGKIVMPKTKISEDIGFMAFFIDTEGNKIALHSKN